MKTIRGRATVDPDGTLTMRLTEKLAPGEHEVALTVLDGGDLTTTPLPVDLPLVEIDAWPEDLCLRRADLYGDWGR